MPAKLQTYPVYIYDEPVTYDNFMGGINTDPSNEHLLDNEMRDCVNMHYLSGALVKRKGAKEVSKLICNDSLTNIQGVFLFTYRLTYIIVAADGRLYYSIFNENTDVQLERLPIKVPRDTSPQTYNPTYLFDGLEEKFTDTLTKRHEGYIYSYETTVGGTQNTNYRGKFEDITNDIIYAGDVVEFVYAKYKCLITHTKRLYLPDETAEDSPWKQISYEEAHELFKVFSSTQSIPVWEESQLRWVQGTVRRYRDKYYVCTRTHTTYERTPSIATDTWALIQEERELIFQNHRKIEAATFDNKLFIATGTRFINVYVKYNQLVAEPVEPHLCNNTEISVIGFNYLSPYPEYCRSSQTNTVTTSIGGLLARKTKEGNYILEPQMTFQIGDSARDYCYRWEKRINNQWYVIHTFKSQVANAWNSSGAIDPITTLTVNDANQFQYRVTFAKSFEKETKYTKAWDKEKYYKEGDFVSVGASTYKCLISHTPSYTVVVGDTEELYYIGRKSNGTKIHWENQLGEFSLTGTVEQSENGITSSIREMFWVEVEDQEIIQYLNIDTGEVSQTYDYTIDKVTGEYFGQATSVLAQDIEINDTFNVIQTCTKIHVDGNKLLLYGDRYNSGQWFKTIINNPGYITDKGNLSFKTTKNEALTKVVAFQGNIICFANSENIGGSIHLVQGNGDDYDAQDGYYSPYRRNTINASISCDNPDTVQICDNILVFKYFNRIYYINASDLSNEVIQVTPCNDRLLQSSKDVDIPWDDNTCISEVTDSYYGLIWKEKYEVDVDGELILKHPGARVKMYYKLYNKLNDNSYTFPWLRDESKYFNVNHLIYVKGKPLFLYDNTLISFEEDNYTDLGEEYLCKIHFRGMDLSYPKMLKLISNVLIYYHRNQYSKLDFKLELFNEAGHKLLDSSNLKPTIQNLKSLKANHSHVGEQLRLDSTILDTKVINTTYKFPCLLVDCILSCKNDKEFSLSSITYIYTTIQTPDTNPYDAYTNIIRKKDILKSSKYKGGY